MYISNNTVVYKTNLGIQVIKNRNRDTLAQPLRTLLIVIDGKTKVSHYKSLLDSYSGVAQFGSVKNMLKELYKSGLVGFHNPEKPAVNNQPDGTLGVLPRWRNSRQNEEDSIEPLYSEKVSLQVE